MPTEPTVFPSLPALTEAQTRRHVEYALAKGWSIRIEHTDDPHPSNDDWEPWEKRTLRPRDPAAVMQEVQRCREAHPGRFMKLDAVEGADGAEAVRLSFLVHRPSCRLYPLDFL